MLLSFQSIGANLREKIIKFYKKIAMENLIKKKYPFHIFIANALQTIKIVKSNLIRLKALSTLLFVFTFCVCATITSCDFPINNHSVPVVERTNVSFGVNDRFDYGAKVGVKVTNEGEAGFVKIMPYLNSSEGNFHRNQDLFLDAGQTQFLTYFFHEISITATDINSGVKCRPPCKILFTSR